MSTPSAKATSATLAMLPKATITATTSTSSPAVTVGAQETQPGAELPANRLARGARGRRLAGQACGPGGQREEAQADRAQAVHHGDRAQRQAGAARPR